MSLYVIYQIVSPQEILQLYAGITSMGVMRRFKEHLSESLIKSNKKNDYICLNADLLHVYLHSTYEDFHVALKAEAALIEELALTEKISLNLTKGGQGALGLVHTTEQRAHNKATALRVKNTPESRAANSARSLLAQGSTQRRLENSLSQKKAQTKPEVKDNQAKGVIKRFGKFYQNTDLERIRNIVPDQGGYRIEIHDGSGKQFRLSGFAHPTDAISTLHGLQKARGLPLSTIPDMYRTGETDEAY